MSDTFPWLAALAMLLPACALWVAFCFAICPPNYRKEDE